MPEYTITDEQIESAVEQGFIPAGMTRPRAVEELNKLSAAGQVAIHTDGRTVAPGPSFTGPAFPPTPIDLANVPPGPSNAPFEDAIHKTELFRRLFSSDALDDLTAPEVGRIGRRATDDPTMHLAAFAGWLIHEGLASEEAVKAAAAGMPITEQEIQAEVDAAARQRGVSFNDKVEGASIYLIGANGETPQLMGQANLRTAIGPDGVGIAQMGISLDEMRALGWQVNAGDTVDIIYQVAGGTGFSQPVKVQIFFGDTPDETLLEAASTLGIPMPDGSATTTEGGETTGPMSDEEMVNFVVGEISKFTAGDNPYLGVRGSAPVVRIVPTAIDPSGQIEVPPVFKEDDAVYWTQGWSLEAKAALQQQLIDAGLGPDRDPDGDFDPYWQNTLATVLAHANARGYAYAGSAGVGQDPEQTKRQLGFSLALNDYARRPKTKVEVPAYRATAMRAMPAPEVLTRDLQDLAQSRIGRKLDSAQLAELGRYWQEALDAQYDQIDMLAYRQQLEDERLRIEPGEELALTPEQESLLNQESYIEARDPNEVVREVFDRMFAADFAQMRQRAKFRGAQVRQGNLEGTIMSTVAAMGGR